MAREITGWITVKGVHIPVYDSESNEDAAKRVSNNIKKINGEKEDKDISKMSKSERLKACAQEVAESKEPLASKLAEKYNLSPMETGQMVYNKVGGRPILPEKSKAKTSTKENTNQSTKTNSSKTDKPKDTVVSQDVDKDTPKSQTYVGTDGKAYKVDFKFLGNDKHGYDYDRSGQWSVKDTPYDIVRNDFGRWGGKSKYEMSFKSGKGPQGHTKTFNNIYAAFEYAIKNKDKKSFD